MVGASGRHDLVQNFSPAIAFPFASVASLHFPNGPLVQSESTAQASWQRFAMQTSPDAQGAGFVPLLVVHVASKCSPPEGAHRSGAVALGRMQACPTGQPHAAGKTLHGPPPGF